MKFAIITQVPHIIEKNTYFSYAPYVKEMNIWIKFVDEVLVVAPLSSKSITAIDLPYQHPKISFTSIAQVNLLGFFAVFNSLIKIPNICLKIFKAMREADHIHLRCPGNIGLLGCFIQILFPKKVKTAKYAGNWDPSAPQPWSYKLQRWILSNTFLTKNMQVLVYGTWENSTKNIRPFFTATYLESDKTDCAPRPLNSVIKFLFVGTLSSGKRPLYVLQLIEKLNALRFNVSLDIYGDGPERTSVENFISASAIFDKVVLHGNQEESVIRNAYQNSHFVILPSKSEGWPKVLAEAMFWRCLPIATKISCVPFMLDSGNRGELIDCKIRYRIVSR